MKYVQRRAERSRNDEYPSGLILVDSKGKPRPYKID